MFRNRLLLSLVVALSFSTLAAADSAPVALSLLHSSAGILSIANTTKTTRAIFTSSNQVSMSASTPFSGPLSGDIMLGESIATSSTGLISGTGGPHNNIRFRTANWEIWNHGHAVSTPEPDSLMLLSTGLIGLAGMMRRKLVRS